MLEQIGLQIDRLRGMGASYVDARWYPYEETSALLMWNGNLKTNTATRESGIGIRVLYKGAWGFSASSDLSNLPALFTRAFDHAQTASKRVASRYTWRTRRQPKHVRKPVPDRPLRSLA